MNLPVKLRIWAAGHSKLSEALRIALGVILIWKGISFLLNLEVLQRYLEETGINDSLGLSAAINFLAQLIIILNLFGGICIALNLKTRLFCWFNLPIVFGAVFLVNMHRGNFEPQLEFWLSLFSLLVIAFILLIGNKAQSHNHHVVV
ncbi:MAG: DoxX family protein [Mucilaginibacter sp.]